MPQVIIENPILNSPFKEPKRHFRFSDEGITDEIIEERRVSSYFIPIAKPKKKGKSAQLAFDTEWTQDRVQENETINRIRNRVTTWRQGGYVGITKTTRRLLEYWINPEREKKLFFCQIEALETAIYLMEVANKYGAQSGDSIVVWKGYRIWHPLSFQLKRKSKYRNYLHFFVGKIYLV